MPSLVTRLEDNSNDGDDALQEEVEEKDRGCTAQQAIEHQKDFSSDCSWRGHAKT